MDELFKQLVVPLLGGFLFIWVNHRARFLLLPASGEKFFLACGVLGAIGLVSGTVVSHIAKAAMWSCSTPWVQNLPVQWHGWFPFSFAQTLALIGLPCVGFALNTRCDKQKAYEFAVARSGDTLEVFFEQAYQEESLILLSLHSGRVYVGMIKDSIRPLAGRRHVKIVPFLSGFRWPLETEADGSDKKPNRVEWSTYYAGIVETILQIGKAADNTKPDSYAVKIPSPSGALVDVDASEMGVVIPIDDIETASRFNPRVYAYLNRDRYPFLEKLEPKSAPENHKAVDEKEPGE